MTTSRLAQKLRIPAGRRVLVVNAPAEYGALINPLPGGTVIAKSGKGPFPFAHVFAHDVAELQRYAPRALDTLEYDAVLWMSYPKGSSKLSSDLNRDHGWELLGERGLRPVAAVSVDSVWSALRFRPIGEVKSRR